MSNIKLTPESFLPLEKKKKDTGEMTRRGAWYYVKQGFKSHPAAIVCLVLLILILVATLMAPLSPYDPDEMVLTEKYLDPSMKHLLGTDNYGRDYFTRILYGGQVSLAVGFFSMAISTVIGTIYGTISGYIGGKLDSFMMRVVDILMSIPSFLIIVMMNTVLKTTVPTLIIIIGIFSWMGVARVVRAEAMTLKSRDFVLASKGLGAGKWWIAVKHIIRNASSQIIVSASLSIAKAILLESVLSFLGFGVAEPTSSWGSMLQTAQQAILYKPQMAVYPGLLILLTVLSFNVIADVLREALEPKLMK